MDVSPTIFVIFGGAGDLTWRKLIPSLFDLYRDGRMPAQFAIIAVDRASFRDAEMRTRFLDDVKQFSGKGKVIRTNWHNFTRHVTYHQEISQTREHTRTCKRVRELETA